MPELTEMPAPVNTKLGPKPKTCSKNRFDWVLLASIITVSHLIASRDR